MTRHRPRWNEPHKLAETTEPTTGAKLEEKGEEGNSSIPAVGVLSAAARRVALEAEVERLNRVMADQDCVNLFLSEGAGMDAIIREKEAGGEEDALERVARPVRRGE